ncbi:acid sphingomyelinase and PHM5 phosphate metabolism protein [Aspergillus steynii IBT 23096]|uniref:Endopolyphosphatase n=1 Tax=Aspergillus steynii IBT 23096 TaxID=1392250 RepID=A0A2I2FT53_9EURO|nr:acid sphingomyelinase and PHM5 phosphate metabolism protein [Aspergillus steynii IBT 23096]PLB43757.1 acid sphingomyelinase and PHM5 phosphate metabolism protein [Aspergillus steynii IBT 23096]
MIPFLFLPPTVLLAACASAIPVSDQQPLGAGISIDADRVSGRPSRGLTGRFLHITADFHPDLHYKSGTDQDDACHRGEGSAGYFGAQGTECDSPSSLINETFRWISQNLKDNVDFVIWTGDSARHDNDESIPRTEDEVIKLNDIIADKFYEVFQKRDSPRGLSIPVVPTIGNNDIMPHNIMKDGPNRWTKKFSDVWSKFIPEHQRHSFVEGGWFTSEVIPGKLAVISLNTMYFYDSNSAVDGCKSKSEPGFEHMEWLRIQLKILRSRDMKAILIGHIPPARSGPKRSWDETCWQKYTLWVHQFRDVVVGSAYGHMNIDHFMLQDSHKVKIADTSEDSESSTAPDSSLDDFSVLSRSSYLSSLRKDWSKMPSPPQSKANKADFLEEWAAEDSLAPTGDDRHAQKSKKKRFLKKIGGPYAERYSVSLVSPSLVPNYFPTLRVVEYNITGLEDTVVWSDTSEEPVDVDSLSDDDDNTVSTDKKKKHKKKKGGKKKPPNFKVPEPPSESAPPGPAYSNQPFTWLSYTQYFANLTRINEQVSKASEQSNNSSMMETGKPPHDDIFSFEVEYDTKDDHAYKMKDLTVRSFFKLATRIAENHSIKSSSDEVDAEKKKKKKSKKNRVWRAFLRRAFVGFLDDDELDDIET